MAQQLSDKEILAKEIKGIKIAMLVTTDDDGQLRSRPMGTQEAEFDGTLWFFSSEETPKVDEIAADSNVNVSYADADNNRYVSVSGTASLVRDRAKIKELWTPSMKAWFPDGPTDPKIVLIKVDVSSAQYWDFASKKLIQLVGFLKATVTGTQFNPPGKQGRVDFKH